MTGYTGKRNDPCYCGSEKKYKKCCWHKKDGFVLDEKTNTWSRPAKPSERELLQQTFGPGSPKMATE